MHRTAVPETNDAAERDSDTADFSGELSGRVRHSRLEVGAKFDPDTRTDSEVRLFPRSDTGTNAGATADNEGAVAGSW